MGCLKLLRAKRIVRADCVVRACVVLNHITRGLRRSSWLLSSGESCGSRLRLRSWSALILVQGVRHQRAKVTVLTGRRDYLRACAAGPRDTICGAVVELDMILRSDPSNTDQGV